jgi:hypothetical protein
MARPVTTRGGDATHDEAVVTMPAELRFLTVARTVVLVATEQADRDAECEDDLQLATDELASVVVSSAGAGTELRMSVAHDDTDIYVRMTAPVADGTTTAAVPELSLILLRATVDSFDVTVHDAKVVAILQRRIRAEPG